MKQPRAWQRMLSGRRLDLLDPTPVDIEIEDIAHGLAFVARWNGQTRGDWPYSVAEHSLLVEEMFARANPGIGARWRLAALLHDAPEYVIGDMISPVKSAVGPGYGELDQRLTAAVHLRFGLPAVLPVADQEGDQGGRPDFGLAGGGADCGVFGGRGRPAVRQARMRERCAGWKFACARPPRCGRISPRGTMALLAAMAASQVSAPLAPRVPAMRRGGVAPDGNCHNLCNDADHDLTLLFIS